jgi:ankyrin repeat protein
MEDEQFKMLCFNIFPKGKTVLHFIQDNGVQIKEVYMKVKSINKKLSIEMTLPFIRDFDGESPLHICIKNQNLQSVNTFLMFLKDDPIDNHARSIVDILPKILEEEVPSFKNYLNARLK